MDVFHDGGHEHSHESLKYFEKHVVKFIKEHPVQRVHINDRRVFSMEIVCVDAVILLSGTGASYPGTAPHAACKILEVLGVPEYDAKIVYEKDDLMFHFTHDGKYKTYVFGR